MSTDGQADPYELSRVADAVIVLLFGENDTLIPAGPATEATIANAAELAGLAHLLGPGASMALDSLPLVVRRAAAAGVPVLIRSDLPPVA